MITTNSKNVNLFDNDYAADILSVIDKWTGQIVGEFLVAAGIAVPFDDEGQMPEFAVAYSDGRSDKAAVCSVCNIDKADAYLRWNI